LQEIRKKMVKSEKIIFNRKVNQIRN